MGDLGRGPKGRRRGGRCSGQVAIEGGVVKDKRKNKNEGPKGVRRAVQKL